MLTYLFIFAVAAIPAFFVSFFILGIINYYYRVIVRQRYIVSKQYHTLPAKKISKNETNDGDGLYHHVFEYEYAEKIYRIPVKSVQYISGDQYVYYINDPANAVADINSLGRKELKVSKKTRMIVRLVVTLIFFVVLVVLWKLH